MRFAMVVVAVAAVVVAAVAVVVVALLFPPSHFPGVQNSSLHIG